MEEKVIATLVLAMVSIMLLLYRLLAGALLDPVFEFLVIHLPTIIAVMVYARDKLASRANLNEE